MQFSFLVWVWRPLNPFFAALWLLVWESSDKHLKSTAFLPRPVAIPSVLCASVTLVVFKTPKEWEWNPVLTSPAIAIISSSRLFVSDRRRNVQGRSVNTSLTVTQWSTFLLWLYIATQPVVTVLSGPCQPQYHDHKRNVTADVPWHLHQLDYGVQEIMSLSRVRDNAQNSSNPQNSMNCRSGVPLLLLSMVTKEGRRAMASDVHVPFWKIVIWSLVLYPTYVWWSQKWNLQGWPISLQNKPTSL